MNYNHCWEKLKIYIKVEIYYTQSLQDPILLKWKLSSELQIQHDPVITPQGFFFKKIDKLIIKLVCEYKELWLSKTIFKNNNKVERVTLPEFKIYYYRKKQ